MLMLLLLCSFLFVVVFCSLLEITFFLNDFSGLSISEDEEHEGD